MPQAVIDANVLIAARLARDQHHDRALKLATAFDSGDLLPCYVPSDVLQEVMNYLQARSTHDQAVETLDALVESSGYEIVQTSTHDFDAGRSVFRVYEGLSLTDAIIVAFMQRTGIEYIYSFDDDFDAVDDITRLDTPVGPSR